MGRMVVTRRIKAPTDKVFATVSEIENFQKAVPHITRVEMLSDIKAGVGTRFRETRLMKGREASTELEVTEYVKNDRIRLVTDSHGTVWDTVFQVEAESGGDTRLTMTMDARAHKMMSRILNPLIAPMVKKAVEQDMDSVKLYCERGD